MLQAADRQAQEAQLPFETLARLAPEQMNANEQALPQRHVCLLHLRDQAARVLARYQSAHDEERLPGLSESVGGRAFQAACPA
jgi:hypothetical protein